VKHQLSQKNIHLRWFMFSNRLENITFVLIHVLSLSNLNRLYQKCFPTVIVYSCSRPKLVLDTSQNQF
jgi:hypothetical protein